jgi:hypothetical protein
MESEKKEITRRGEGEREEAKDKEEGKEEKETGEGKEEKERRSKTEERWGDILDVGDVRDV